ncbi:MAG: hypothetical protein ACR2J8_11850, partial [Thermomicrobiales bacterium]
MFSMLAKSPFLNHKSETTSSNILMFAVGMFIVGWSSNNAIRTFMLPGAANPTIGKLVFRVVQVFFLGVGRFVPGQSRKTALY